MIVYAIYQRNTHQGAGWERVWYEDSGDYYLGKGLPESISAGPTEDLTGYMSRAFILAADPETNKKSAQDKDLSRMNKLLSLKEIDHFARREIRELRHLLDERYNLPLVQTGQKVYAAYDDEYTRRAWELQTGGRDGIGVRHTVAKTMLGAVFSNEAAAKSFSHQGVREFEITEDQTALSAKAALHKFVDRMFRMLRP